MRVLILGASGLIGHQLCLTLNSNFEVFGTLHGSKNSYGDHPLFAGPEFIDEVDVQDFTALTGIFKAINPDVILNCVGITKRKKEILNPIDALSVNALFPHKLAQWAEIHKKRIIHFSTDCVFDGREGNYTETSLTTASDMYGRTKALGEINYDHTLTIRSSFIGQELFQKSELLEWLLAQEGKQIKGFANTMYSGVSTIYLSRFIKKVILEYPKLNGLYNLSPEVPISKFELLSLAKEAYKLNIEIIRDDEHIHKPTLDSSKLRSILNPEIPSWKSMLQDLYSKKNMYLNI